MFQLTLWSAPPFLVILLTLWSMFSLRDKKHIPGTLAINWVLAAACFWCIALLFRSLVTTIELKILATQMAEIGMVFLPVAWFAFTVTYSNNETTISSRALLALAIVPCITLGLAFTNEQHQLIWYQWQLTNLSEYIGLSFQAGSFFPIIAIYSFCLVLCGTAIAINRHNQSQHKELPIITICFTPILIAASILIDELRLTPFQGVEFTSLGLLLGGFLFRAGVVSAGILSHMRIRRHTVVEQLSDMVIIIDTQAGILDFNAAAAQGLHIQPNSNYKREKLRLPALLEMMRTNSSSTELIIDARTYDVRSTPLTPRFAPTPNMNKPAERALVFRDITASKEAQRALLQAKLELQTLAHTDPLTGLYNRRFFMQRLEEEAERLRRHKNPLSCLLFDLDHFKIINDTFGHDAGDKVLKMVAQKTLGATRITDVAARIGGEEFAMLLPETDTDGALRLANRLRESIAKECIYSENRCVNVTTSIGVVTVDQVEDNLDSLLTQADKALYQAKNSGRNMVCIAD